MLSSSLVRFLVTESVRLYYSWVYHLVFQAIMEDLSVMWKKFLLSEKEESEYIGQIFETTGGKVLAAKFFTRRVLNMEAIARTFKQLWQTKKSFEIKDMGNHVVLFVFSDKMDADKVLLGEPWSYDKHLVALRRMEKKVAVKDLVFDQTFF